MSLEAILKNICTFLELLQKARVSNDLDWNVESFRNAFQWAEYCERIYLQSLGKPYYRQLDSEIRKLNCLPWTLGDLTVDLKLLRDSVGWLSLALIQNESASSNDIRLKIIQEKASQNEFLKLKLKEMIAMNSIVKSMSSIELGVVEGSTARDIAKLTSDVEKLKLEASATLLADYMQKNLSFELRDATMQRMVLRDKLQQLADSEDGLIIILKTYLVLFESQKRSYKRVLKYFDDFVSGLVERSDVRFWCSIPKNVAVETCSTNEDFLKKLFMDLDRASKNFEVHYNENIVDETTGRISLFCWRFNAKKATKKSSPITSSDQLKEWIVAFLDAPDMGDKAAEIISELAKSSEVNIWKTLLQELKRIDLIIDCY